MSCSDKNRETIENMDELLQTGITQSSTDGTSNSFDLAFLARRRRELALRDPLLAVTGQTRPLFTTIRMPGY